jgi:hypothetical protein
MRSASFYARQAMKKVISRARRDNFIPIFDEFDMHATERGIFES